MHRMFFYTSILLLILAAPVTRYTRSLSQQKTLYSPINAGALQAVSEQRKSEYPEWSYSGPNGPENWVKNYPDCGRKDQSPINITSPIQKPLPEITFNYVSSPLFIMNNGHTIQIDFPASGPANTISIGGKEYRLSQFHFHEPSEEHLAGKTTDMVVHLVHQHGEGAYMRLAVVAVTMNKGEANALIEKLWQHIPSEVSHEPVEVPGVSINPAELLPANHGYFTYLGSLTTPPCTEIVTWYILKTSTHLSSGQVETFKKYYTNNVRPVQPLNGRAVEQTQ